jgi:hypothetical protein
MADASQREQGLYQYGARINGGTDRTKSPEAESAYRKKDPTMDGARPADGRGRGRGDGIVARWMGGGPECWGMDMAAAGAEIGLLGSRTVIEYGQRRWLSLYTMEGIGCPEVGTGQRVQWAGSGWRR